MAAVETFAEGDRYKVLRAEERIGSDSDEFISFIRVVVYNIILAQDLSNRPRSQNINLSERQSNSSRKEKDQTYFLLSSQLAFQAYLQTISQL